MIGYFKDRENLCKYPPAKPGALRLLAPQRGLIAIDQNQNREPFIGQSIAKFLFLSFLRKQESSFLWIPGHVSFARNDDSMFPELSNSGSPPAEPGVYLNANYVSWHLIASFITFCHSNPCPLESFQFINEFGYALYTFHQ